MAIDVVVVVLIGDAPTLLSYPRGTGYKESPLASYNCNPNMTLSLIFPNYNFLSY
jgi:hypothetical protein